MKKLKMLKKKLKNMIIKVDIDKSDVVFIMKSSYSKLFSICIDGKNYGFKNGKVYIKNCSGHLVDKIIKNEFAICVCVFGLKLTSWKLKKENVVKSEAVKSIITFNGNVLNWDESINFEIEKITEEDDAFLLQYHIYDIFDRFDSGSLCIISDETKEENIVSIEVKQKEGVLRLLKGNIKARQQKVFFFLDKATAKCGYILNKNIENTVFDEETFSIKNGICNIYSSLDNLTPNYVQENLNIDRLGTSKYIKRIVFKKDVNGLFFEIKEKKEFDKFILYIRRAKNNKSEEIFRSNFSKTIAVNNLKNCMNVKIDRVEKYFFEYELRNKSDKVVERNKVVLNNPQVKKIEDYILMKHNENVLTYHTGQLLMLLNAENNNLKQDAIKFDLAKNTIFALCDNLAVSDLGISFDLILESFLSRIKKYSIFVRNNYNKRETVVYESNLINEKKCSENIKLNKEKLERILTFDARLNFRVNVEFINGSTESIQISGLKNEYSAEERLCCHREMSDGNVWSLYLGENKYLLNLWKTSEEEYRKSFNYQTSKEVYISTLENESVDENLIIFEAFLGKNYSGNPKYIYEEMLENPQYKNFKFVWSYAGDNPAQIKGEPIIVERGTKEYFYYLAKAKYWVNNILFPVKEKRTETIYLQTWHGTPLKKLGFDIKVDGPEKQSFGNLYAESQNWDYLLADNDYGEEKLVGAFRFKKTLIKEGYPINDIFYDKEKSDYYKKIINEKYNPKNKGVILYAPTWRDLDGDYVRGFEFKLPFDLKKMYEEIGSDYIVLVKVHHLIADNLSIPEEYKEFIYNVSDIEDIQTLLVATDVLITDYSSVFYDYANARKPIVFYMYDMERYITKTRGLYVSVDDLPGPVVKDTDELIKVFKSIIENEFEYTDKLNSFCKDMTKYSTGNSSKRILDRVIGGSK